MIDNDRNVMIDSIIHDEASVRHYQHLVDVYGDEDLKHGAFGLYEDAQNLLVKHRQEFKQRYPDLDLDTEIKRRMVEAKTVMV